MRLIDADDFLKFMMALEEHGAEHISFDDLRKFIEEQPTAYDVDKIVGQLEEQAKTYDDPVNSNPDFRRYCHGIAVGYRYAIEIVSEELERRGKPERDVNR